MAKISDKNVAEAIYRAARGKSGHEQKEILRQAVRVLAKKNLLGKSKTILSVLGRIADQDQKIIRARLKSAHHVSEHSKDELARFLKKRYGAREVEFSSAYDKNLLGGLKVEVEDEIMDNTLKGRIQKLENYLIQLHE